MFFIIYFQVKLSPQDNYDFEASECIDDKTNDDNSVDFELKTRALPGVTFTSNVKPRWFLNGTISSKQSENIMNLIRDMTNGKLSEKWSLIAKAASK